MVKKKATKKTVKKVDKKTEKKLLNKKPPKKIKRLEDGEQTVEEVKAVDFDKVKTEIVINNGVVIVNPIYNPFDDNK